MEEPENQLGYISGPAQFAPPRSVVSLSPFSPIPSPSSRRLSSHFTPPTRPLQSARKLAWVSLQGRLVNAEEASSVKAIGRAGLSRDQIIAWELFTPIQRFLIVAVIGVAVAESKKNKFISQLTKSVELRDQVLSRMQQKLDDLCEQLNSMKNHSKSSDVFGSPNIKFFDCGCWHCDHHKNIFASLMGNSAEKLSRGDEMLQYKMPLVNEAEQEERRMSDLSDWASSVTSSVDFQMNTSSIDLDISNIKKESEEKDATIKELTNVLHSTNMAGSKRTAELEDIIRRKNNMITKLKKDILVLEQKLVHLTRLQRPSSSSSSVPHNWQYPLMLDNIIYDMDSNTSPSCSDSDSPPVNRPKAPVTKNQFSPLQNTPLQNRDLQKPTSATKASSSSVKLTEQQKESVPVTASPLKEISINQKSTALSSSSRPKQLSANGEFKKIRRRMQTASSDAAPKKRWM